MNTEPMRQAINRAQGKDKPNWFDRNERKIVAVLVVIAVALIVMGILFN